MAGEWIKMRVDLQDDPAVIAIADDTGLDEYSVIGRLHKLWGWADRHTLDGNGLCVTQSWVDRFVGCDGFAEAMVLSGWLTNTDAKVGFPHFDRHNGETAKKRALTNKRVAEHRELQRNNNATGNADSVTESVTREEKRREEVKSKALVADATTDPVSKPNGSHVLIPDCPHEKIVALYEELCPTLTGVKTWGEQRKALSRSRWRETFQRLHLSSENEGLEWFGTFFTAVNQSSFLTGKVPNKDGAAPWAADLEWLLRPNNFAKVLDGKYWDR